MALNGRSNSCANDSQIWIIDFKQGTFGARKVKSPAEHWECSKIFTGYIAAGSALFWSIPKNVNVQGEEYMWQNGPLSHSVICRQFIWNTTFPYCTHCLRGIHVNENSNNTGRHISFNKDFKKCIKANSIKSFCRQQYTLPLREV